uniref:9.8K protein n=1 Tax=Berne virus TaxID=11156 RepID=Q65482_BEV|nr:9.8K protein [Berne virus]
MLCHFNHHLRLLHYPCNTHLVFLLVIVDSVTQLFVLCLGDKIMAIRIAAVKIGSVFKIIIGAITEIVISLIGARISRLKVCHLNSNCC